MPRAPRVRPTDCAASDSAGVRPLRRRKPSERGMAIVIVLTTIAVLSVSITEFLYNTRVNLFLAQNQRDEVKAYFLARSGVNLQLLTLQFQYDLEEEGGLIGQAVTRSNFQLWEYLPLLLPTFNSATLTAPIGSVNLEDTGATGFGGLSGEIDFHDVVPEEGKINLNAFSSREIDDGVREMAQRICDLVRLPNYDSMFGSSADEAQRERFELVGAIIDHIDSDSDMTLVDERCQLGAGGAGQESSRYDDLDWEPKNAPLLSVQEIAMVPGVTDGFLREFGHQFTVYPVASMFHANLSDAQGFAGFLCANIIGGSEELNPCSYPVIGNQVTWLALAFDGYVKFFRDKFNLISFYLGLGMFQGAGAERVSDGTAAGLMTAFRQPRDFTSRLREFMESPELAAFFASYSDPRVAMLFGYSGAMGIDYLVPEFGITFDEARMLQRVSTDVPRIFTVSSTGRYGQASRTITTVADYREQARLLYWREF